MPRPAHRPHCRALPPLPTSSRPRCSRGARPFGYESRYFIEGRDSLDGDSIITTTVELAYQHLALDIWYGISPEQNYDEMQISAAYTDHLGDLEYYFSWTHLQFNSLFPGSESDNEIGFGLAYDELPYHLSVSFDAYYSLDAEGSFLELGLDRSFELSDSLTLGVGGAFGMNQGYVSEGHDGANHLALTLWSMRSTKRSCSPCT